MRSAFFAPEHRSPYFAASNSSAPAAAAAGDRSAVLSGSPWTEPSLPHAPPPEPVRKRKRPEALGDGPEPPPAVPSPPPPAPRGPFTVATPEDAQAHAIQRSLLQWYAVHQRSVPWRRTADPYSVWVSEMMLIQTQVKTVVRHFQRWMDAYPTLRSVAEESDPHRLHDAWGPLGLYRRVDLLKRGAEYVMERHGGEVPRDVAQLRAIPGVGPYAAGMIASTCFGQREAAVDGNVVRLLCRLFYTPLDATDASLPAPRVAAAVWRAARALVPDGRAGDWNQAIMDLGAKVCTPRRPRCSACPLRPHCAAHRLTAESAPPMDGRDRIGGIIPPAAANRYHHHQALHICVLSLNGKWALLTLRPADGGPLGGTWQFPTLEGPIRRRFKGDSSATDCAGRLRDIEALAGDPSGSAEEPSTSDDEPPLEQLVAHLEAALGCALRRYPVAVRRVGVARYALTHLRWTLQVRCLLLRADPAGLAALLAAAHARPGVRWVPWARLHAGDAAILLTGPVRRVLAMVAPIISGITGQEEPAEALEPCLDNSPLFPPLLDSAPGD